MADIMGMVMGTGGTTTEERAPDPLTQQINQIRADQVRALLGYKGYENWMANQFMQPNAAYTPNPDVQRLYQAAATPLFAGPSMSLQDYQNLGFGTAGQNLTNAMNLQNNALDTARRQSYANTTAGVNTLGNVLTSQEGTLGNVLNLQQGALGNVLNLQQGTLGDILRSGQGTLANLTNQRQTGIDEMLNRQVAADTGVLSTGRDINLQGLNLASNQNRANFANLFGTLKDLGLDTSSNYIRQIATPQIQQQMALQGLEGGGAVESAIAKASAEYGMPVFQALASLAGQFQGAQSGLGSQYLSGEQGLAGQYGQNVAQAYAQGSQAQNQALADLFSGNTSLLGQYGQGMQSSLGQYGQGMQNSLGQYGQGMQSVLGQYGGNVGNLLSQYNAGDLGLFNQYMGNLGNLSGQYNQGMLNFIGSLPGAQQTLQVTPAQTAAALFPLADYSGQLAREDLNRRQGLFGTTMTGLPYTPGGTVEQRKETDDIFKRLGGMAGSASGSFPAFATMGLA